ncbi:MAG: hypothetical protein LBT08_02120, partial [Synergistaceae bacterium]|nr:hypothetical protein [Synergistaceae bacterium]
MRGKLSIEIFQVISDTWLVVYDVLEKISTLQGSNALPCFFFADVFSSNFEYKRRGAMKEGQYTMAKSIMVIDDDKNLIALL